MVWRRGGIRRREGWGRTGPLASIVVTGREKVDSIVCDLIDQAVFGIDAARPSTGELSAKSFGLAHTTEGIAQDRFHQLERAQGPSSIGSSPVGQVLKKRTIEYSFLGL